MFDRRRERQHIPQRGEESQRTPEIIGVPKGSLPVQEQEGAVKLREEPVQNVVLLK